MSPGEAVDAVLVLLDRLEEILVDLRHIAEHLKEEDEGADAAESRA